MDAPPLTPGALEAVRVWFRAEARDYPWSATEDPYAIWISEVMLQQTVVTAAVAPYTAWMDRWPDVAALARAHEEEVLRAWEGLGYASRARNLHRAARVLADRGLNNLPGDEDALRALPGVGEYTAAAILSFAFHQPTLTLDANLKRVFQRLGGVPDWRHQDEAAWRRRWAELVGATSREANQAVMQLGQRVCRPRNPSCGACPLAEGCRARADGTTASIPAGKARVVIDKATSVVFWYRNTPDTGRLWFLGRPLKGRFSNLWLVAPVEETPEGAYALSSRVHTYTKYRDRLTSWVSRWDGSEDPPLSEGWVGRWVTAEQAHRLGMVSTYRRLLDEALDRSAAL